MLQRFFILTWICAAAWAQNVSGSLSGTVQDALGAVIPGADITVKSTQGFVRTSKTNPAGFFSFPDLTPSTYSLTVSAKGFKKYEQTEIAITSSEQRSAGAIVLQVGEMSDSITVTAEAAPVQLGSSEKAGVITADDIDHMALRGRDFMDAVSLMAGVVDTNTSREAPSPTSIGGIYILGGRANAKNMTIDGVTNLDTGSNGSVHSMPSMDSVGEIKVLMSNYAAEYGRNSGGSVTVITRGGGKQFHGSAGWYYRHESFSANNFFNNRNKLSRPPYRYNIGSYNIGGPVYIPGKFNRDRSKLFFFFSQEFQRQRVDYGMKTVRVPTELERAGDFSQSFDVNKKLFTIWDPNNNRKAFPDNVVPPSLINATGRKILGLFPMPNFVDPAPSRLYQWNYISQMSGAYPRRTEIIRLDYSPRQNLQMYFRGSNNADEQHPTYNNWTTGSVNYPLTPIVFRQPGRGATIHTTATLSPTMFNEAILGVSQNKLTYFAEFPERVSRQATGINLPQWYPAQNPAGLLPNMSFSGVPNYANPSMSNGVPYYNSNTIFSLVENVSKISGTHSYKFGMYVERTRKDQSASSATRGAVNFDRNSNNPLDTNYPYSNALMGIYNSYSEATARPQGQYRFTNLEWYAQDAWRIRSRLLVDYGVRFYHDMPQYDARLQLASFAPERWDPAHAPVLLRPGYDASRQKVAIDPLSGKVYPQGLIGTFVPGVGDPANGMFVGGRTPGYPRGMYSIPALGLAPRFGFAWDPFGRGRTALRGGGGIFFDRIQGNPTMDTLPNPPTVYTPSVYYGWIDSLGDAAGQGILAPSTIGNSLLGKQKNPTVYNYSFGIQQQIGRYWIADLSYAGSISRHLLWKRNINPVAIGANWVDVHPENIDPTVGNRALPSNFLRPYMGYGDINIYEFASTSNYNSLLASVNRKWNRGLTFGFAYTFSKVLGSANSDTSSVSTFFAPRQRNYGPLSFDRTHVASMRYSWTLPKPGKRYRLKTLGHFTDGWEVSGTTRIQSGSPFTPGYSLMDWIDVTGTPSEGGRPVVLDPNAPPVQRFGRPARGDFGNAGQGVLRNPGMNNWDASLYRTLKVAEKTSLQLRFETYNLPNHTQFSGVSTTARFQGQDQIDPLFLQPTSALSPRRIQFAARLNW